MRRDSYMIRAAEGEYIEAPTIFNEAMHEIGTALAEVINSFHPADLPLTIAVLDLYSEALKNHLPGSSLEIVREAKNNYSAIFAWIKEKEEGGE